MKKALWTATLLLLALFADVEAAKKKPKPRGFPIQPGIYRLYGTDPALAQNDLEPLRQIVGKATIVGLGESVHTSGGYYEMKHRLFRFLVEKMGFRAFAFESPWPDADLVGRYVATCEGTPEEALTGLFGVWESAETRALVQWMCEWNRSHSKAKDKLVFFGFDVQQPGQDGPALLAFLERLGVGAGDPRVADIRECDGVGRPTVYPQEIPESRHRRCLAGLAAAEQLIEQEAAQGTAGISSEDLEYARLRAVGVRSWEGQVYYRGIHQWNDSVESRDAGMAYAFAALRRLRYGDVKTAIWAHNFHIAKDVPGTSWGMRTTGWFLRDTFGPSYAAVALVANVAEIDWPGVGCGESRSLRTPNTVETQLHELGHETLLLDFDFPGGNPPFLAPGRIYRFTEAGMVPGAQFDGAVFLERSRKMDPLSWSSCQ